MVNWNRNCHFKNNLKYPMTLKCESAATSGILTKTKTIIWWCENDSATNDFVVSIQCVCIKCFFIRMIQVTVENLDRVDKKDHDKLHSLQITSNEWEQRFYLTYRQSCDENFSLFFSRNGQSEWEQKRAKESKRKRIPIIYSTAWI